MLLILQQQKVSLIIFETNDDAYIIIGSFNIWITK